MDVWVRKREGFIMDGKEDFLVSHTHSDKRQTLLLKQGSGLLWAFFKNSQQVLSVTGMSD